jgi:hypothetical protein
MRVLNLVYSYIGSIFGISYNENIPANVNERDGNNNDLLDKQENVKTPSISISSCYKILNDEMLTDNEIYLALELLKKQFQSTKNIKGLFDPQALNTKLAKKAQFYIEYPDRFIQILHNGDMHWFTITNMKSNFKYQIQSYDSYFMSKSYLNNTKFENYLKKLLLPSVNLNQSIQILDNSIEHIYAECSVEPVKMQTNEKICGLYAIAFAYDLCTGIDPSTRNYNEDKMRKHLFKCLNQSHFEPFPVEKNNEPYKMTQSQILFIDLSN